MFGLLGYALASDKDICLICSGERTSKYPFDVQHRTIIKYKLESKDDFASLQQKIAGRLTAIVDKFQNLAILEARSPIKEPEGLLQHEMMVLVSVAENRRGPGNGVDHRAVRSELERLGYNNLALNIGLEGLLEKQMISYEYDEYDSFQIYFITQEGMKWICSNYERLNLNSTLNPKKAQQPKKGFQSDNDIPFG